MDCHQLPNYKTRLGLYVSCTDKFNYVKLVTSSNFLAVYYVLNEYRTLYEISITNY